MKHKVGDKVRIKSLDWYNENKDINGYICGFTPKMSEYCGKTATIVKVGSYHYELDIDNGSWWWDDEMFDENYNIEQIYFTILIPRGYELDKEMSTFEKIVLKKKENDVKTWNDLVCKQIPDGSKWIAASGDIIFFDRKLGEFDKNVYIDEKHAKSALAMAQISQLMPYYGGAITDEEWNNSDVLKYSICRNEDYVSFKSQHYELLSFHTEEQRNDFLKYNEQLVKDYLMITENEK